jgi:hypothetical protein
MQQNVLGKIDTLHEAVTKARRDQSKLDAEFNLYLADQKRQRALQVKQQETEQNVREIQAQINGLFLTEREDPYAVHGKVKVRVDIFKGMTVAQRQAVRDMQAQQRLEKQLHNVHRQEEEQIWAAKSRASQRALELMAREKHRQEKKVALQIQEENESKKVEDKQRYVCALLVDFCSCHVPFLA